MFNSIAIVTDVSQVRYYCWHNKIVQLSLGAGCGGVFGLVLEHIELWRRRTVIKSFWLVSMITEKACGTDIALEYNRYAGLKLSSTLIVFFQQCWRYQILCQKKPAGFLGFLLLLFLKNNTSQKQWIPNIQQIIISNFSYQHIQCLFTLDSNVLAVWWIQCCINLSPLLNVEPHNCLFKLLWIIWWLVLIYSQPGRLDQGWNESHPLWEV